MQLVLTRDEKQTVFCTTGKLEGDILEFPIYTLEDPWKGNARRVSCIPKGVYECVPHGWEANARLRFPRTWRLLNVPNRDAILIHAGNTHLDTHGCILIGFNKTIARGEEPRLIESRMAVDYLRRVIGPKGFTLTIK